MTRPTGHANERRIFYIGRKGTAGGREKELWARAGRDVEHGSRKLRPWGKRVKTL